MKNTNKISIQEVKYALNDPEFRKKLPVELAEDLQKYEQNPGCPCNMPFYRKLLQVASKQLREHFPGRQIVDADQELMKLAENHWSVISCHISELENRLRKLPAGRKQIAIARHEDQVTVVINELDLAF